MKTGPGPTNKIKKAPASAKIASRPLKKTTKPAQKNVMTIKRKARIRAATRSKPIDLLSDKKESFALAKLQTLEKDLTKDTPFENKNKINEIEESDILEMLSSLDNIIRTKDKSVTGGNMEKSIDNLLESQNQILDRLSELGKEISAEKNNAHEIKKKQKSKSLEKLEELEKKWSNEALNTQHYVGNQTYPAYPEIKRSGIYEELERLGTYPSVEKPEGPEKKWSNEALNTQQYAGNQTYPNLKGSGIYEELERLGIYPSVSNNTINKHPSFLSVYFSLIKHKTKANWENPSGAEILSETETNIKTIVSFNILRSGHVEDYEIRESSGNLVLDRLALMAVKNSAPMPPLPAEYHEHFLRVFIDFNYLIK